MNPADTANMPLWWTALQWGSFGEIVLIIIWIGKVLIPRTAEAFDKQAERSAAALDKHEKRCDEARERQETRHERDMDKRDANHKQLVEGLDKLCERLEGVEKKIDERAKP
jgi:hypothetical protein